MSDTTAEQAWRQYFHGDEKNVFARQSKTDFVAGWRSRDPQLAALEARLRDGLETMTYLKRLWKAEAWDEGYGDDVTATTPRTNPYREATE